MQLTPRIESYVWRRFTLLISTQLHSRSRPSARSEAARVQDRSYVRTLNRVVGKMNREGVVQYRLVVAFGLYSNHKVRLCMFAESVE